MPINSQKYGLKTINIDLNQQIWFKCNEYRLKVPNVDLNTVSTD